jgi:hypothetical protein
MHIFEILDNFGFHSWTLSNTKKKEPAIVIQSNCRNQIRGAVGLHSVYGGLQTGCAVNGHKRAVRRRHISVKPCVVGTERHRDAAAVAKQKQALEDFFFGYSDLRQSGVERLLPIV